MTLKEELQTNVENYRIFLYEKFLSEAPKDMLHESKLGYSCYLIMEIYRPIFDVIREWCKENDLIFNGKTLRIEW